MTRTAYRYKHFRTELDKIAYSLINAQVNDFIVKNHIRQTEIATECDINKATVSSSIHYRRKLPRKKLILVLLYLSEKYGFKIKYKNGVTRSPYNSIEENIEKFRLNDPERLK